MINIDFIDNGFSASFIDLVHQFNAETNGASFSIPDNIGSGTIMKSKIGDGLIIYLWDVKLWDDMHVKRSRDINDKENYCLSFFIEPENIKFHSRSELNYKMADVSHYCFVSSTKAVIDLIIEKNTSCKFLTFSIPHDMLTTETQRDLKDQVQRHPLGFRFFALKFEEHKAAHCFFDMVKNNKPLMQLRLQSLVFFDALMNNIHFLSSSRLKKISSDQQKMLNIERKIIESVETNIPSLAMLADELKMSESSIKRHFKLLFGKSVYQYYLEKKMQHAKSLLLHSRMNVSEVSAKLGYEKVSHFISMFKKHTGYLPSKLKN